MESCNGKIEKQPQKRNRKFKMLVTEQWKKNFDFHDSDFYDFYDF